MGLRTTPLNAADAALKPANDPGSPRRPRLVVGAQAAEKARKAAKQGGEAREPPLNSGGLCRAERKGRGGYRNRADRRTGELTLAQCRNLVEAAAFAARIGLPLNRFTTVHWELAGVAGPLAATGRLLKKYHDLTRSHGFRGAAVWVREGGPGKGEHVHILLHVPPALAPALKRLQRGWLKACGAAWRKGAVFSEPIGLNLTHAWRDPRGYRLNLEAVVAYCLKAAAPDAAAALGVTRLEPGGWFTGKRCGVSANLGRAARRRGGGSK